MEQIFDTIPIILAVYCLIISTANYSSKRRRSDNVISVIASIASIMLIVAQTSWWISVSMGDLKDTWIANSIWTFFNAIVMVAFIIFGRSRS